MNVITKSLIAAMVFGGSVATATASSVITDIAASGPGLGSFSLEESPLNFYYLSTTYASAAPITLTFTVGHGNILFCKTFFFDVYRVLFTAEITLFLLEGQGGRRFTLEYFGAGFIPNHNSGLIGGAPDIQGFMSTVPHDGGAADQYSRSE